MVGKEILERQETKSSGNPNKKDFIKKITIIAVVCIIVLLLVIFILRSGKEPSSVKDNSENWGYVSQAQESGSAEECLKISDERLRKSCSDDLNFASSIRENDISFCEKIEDSSMKENCKKNIILKKAFEEKNPDLCNELEDSASCKDDINMRIAFTNLDVSSCNKIVQTDKKDSCLSDVVPFAAVIQDNIDLCENHPSKKGECMNHFYYLKSIDDKQLCNKISDKSLQNLCLSDETLSNSVLKSMDIITGTKQGSISRIFINASDGSTFAIIR